MPWRLKLKDNGRHVRCLLPFTQTPYQCPKGGLPNSFFFLSLSYFLVPFFFSIFFLEGYIRRTPFFFPNSFLSLEFVPFNQAKVDRCNLTKSQFQVIARLITLSAEHFDPSPRTSHQFSLCLFFYLFKFYFLRKKKREKEQEEKKGEDRDR